MTERYAVIGNPISHSKSPQIHGRFAAQTGADLSYVRLWAPEDGFEAVAGAFFAGGGHGLNVTVPFKGQAHAFADTLTDRARTAGAVNTLRAEPDGSRLGDNTDGVGLIRDLLDNLRVPLSGARILVLGAGGAARGILPAVLEQEPAELIIANRTRSRAEALADDLPPTRAMGLDELGAEGVDLALNTTAAGLHDEMPALPAGLLASGAAAYDLVYADHDTPFMAWAREHGAGRVSDGLGMLVEQAAESFYLWRGRRPDTAPVIEALRRGEDGPAG